MCQGKQVKILHEPVAVRRLFVFSCSDAVIRGQAIGITREGEKMRQVEIPAHQSLRSVIASADFEGNNFFRRIQYDNNEF